MFTKDISMLKKDKQKVLGEHFDDARILTFLDHEAKLGIERDYHLLEKAYRGMNDENFATFVRFFVQKGHDINTKNLQGNTFLEEIRQHRHSEKYIQSLEEMKKL